MNIWGRQKEAEKIQSLFPGEGRSIAVLCRIYWDIVEMEGECDEKMRRNISNNAELMESLLEWYAVFPQGIHMICT